MLLAIDIGNTTVAVAIFRDRDLFASFRLSSHRTWTSDEIGLMLISLLHQKGVKAQEISHAVLASVVPVLTQRIVQAVVEYLNCDTQVVTHESKLPITLDIDEPSQLGADRIANAVGGFIRHGGPVIIVDFGTATTLDVVNRTGHYLGGIILPGPETAMGDLARRAARLFEVSFTQPAQVVGKNTADALRSGMFYGTIGQIDFLIEKVIAETGFMDETVVATGGLAKGIDAHSRFVRMVDQNLTLEGLRIIAEGR